MPSNLSLSVMASPKNLIKQALFISAHYTIDYPADLGLADRGFWLYPCGIGMLGSLEMK
jgi:hypothetical protein